MTWFVTVPFVFGQTSYFKFPITKAGIYQLSLAELPQLKDARLENIAIYGASGMLPQKLEEESLHLQELPSLLLDGKLLVYLEGPHQIKTEGDSLHYRHHSYTDTAYYLVKTHVTAPKRLSSELPAPADAPTFTTEQAMLYALYAYKKETINLLSSGRKWYGNRVRAGGIASFNMQVDPYDQGPIYYHANLLAQSTSEATLRIRSRQQEFFSTVISAIPSSTYGLKGREKHISGFTGHVDVGNPTQFNLELKSSDPNAVGFLDYFLLGLPHLAANVEEGIYMNLNHEQPISLDAKKHLLYWDVTQSDRPEKLSTSAGTVHLRPYQRLAIADPMKAPKIHGLQSISQNIRQINPAELVVITSPSLRFQANKLADFKRSIGISTAVVTPQEIYDAYNYGTRDVTAIRNFLADQYHRHQTLQHVLLFGKGTFDYKHISPGHPNLVPTYSSRNSLHPLTSFGSDDYFGFLEFGQGQWAESEAGDLPLAIGVGRLPVTNTQEARNVVEKIIQYETHSLQLGKWKRKLLFVADDGDYNVHLDHSETHTASLYQSSPFYDVQKLYLDAFKQVAEGSFQTAPEAKAALAESMEDGALLINYIGHGNDNTLAAERIFQVQDLQNWPETQHFPLIVTATCEFGRHDSPYLRSGAEELLIAKNKGAIALLTTGRPVFSSINFSLNKAFISAFQENDEGQGLQLGDIFKATKNNSLNGPYNRNFSLLGDPSLRLARPELSIDLTVSSAKGTAIDTLYSHQPTRITGTVRDPLTGLPMHNFDGTFLLEILGEPITVKTNGDEGPASTFQELNNIRYRGSGNITNGQFTAEIFVGQDTLGRPSDGIIRIFASSESSTFEAINAQAISLEEGTFSAPDDREGPSIRLFANDTIQSPTTVSSTQITFIASLKDESGIQTTSENGQGIMLKVNGNSPIVLDNYYRTIHGNYQQGIIEMPIGGLEEGINTLELTAYDHAGNASTQTLKIKVSGSENIKIEEIINYPNPTNDISYFKIKHNRPNENIILYLTIYNLLGKKIYSTEKRYPKASTEIPDLEWIFLRDMTKIPAKGTYIYELQLTSERDGTSDQAIGKINIQ
ncbi:type IX secretion system sortase PorU [Echinicola vietnamensis]|uniref:type IX secretion system sortase PorU n=1 Tax=Echinicola vietnamensis TaxID=390884 RepID=UPI00030697A0|nr:type IX secretion system sortase PorU [Echinicola vietnamensis]